jgi:RluA family pseudouridine synthase
MGGIPFPELQMLFRKGKVTLNGDRTTGSARLERGDIVEIDLEKDRSESPAKAPMSESVPALLDAYGRIGEEIPIVFEDKTILVIDKPAGLIVQPGNRKELGSLLDLLDDYMSRFGREPEGRPGFRFSPVHRLDRETSGLLVIAKTRAASRTLSAAFSEGRIEKIYLAVTDSPPEPASGKIDSPISVEKKADSRAKTDRGGKRAISSYSKIMDLSGGRALVEVTIETGRTHQVRVHLASIGTPIAGDTKYGSKEQGRIMLHAWRLRLPHPRGEEELTLEAIPPPGFGPQR